ncbi:flagellar protein FlaG [Clostridium grantii]|uniref:Flagellar protein FlaG n=1 Tax=Clostridium grantii DSM 8605 TaxID=1121316 RepID=A0A1M5W7P3_9CLOT|nr:flagellar protein FlaG [Clostridium grantii]SHH83458.1 flagellar protein FlaG [Clostridium grantii DSM 8605]
MDITKVVATSKSNEPMITTPVATSVTTKMDGVDIDIKEDKSKSSNGQSTHPGKEDFSSEFLEKEIDKLNKVIFGTNKDFKFSVHEKTNTIVVRVVDSETKEVIKELPPEQILDLVAKMEEMVGMLVDEKG